MRHIKLPNKRELQQITSSQLSNIEVKDFMKLHKDYLKELFFIFSEQCTFTIIFRINLS